MTLITPNVIAIHAVFAQPLKIYLEHFYIKTKKISKGHTDHSIVSSLDSGV